MRRAAALTGPGIAERQRETAFADLLFDTPAEALDRGCAPQGGGRHFG
jgi:hypothetical protein